MWSAEGLFVRFVRRVAVTAGGHRVIVVVSNSLAMKAVAVASSMTQIVNSGEDLAGAGRARRLLAGFREELYGCLTARADELFGLADAVLCAEGPVRVLAGLSLAPGHGRGHGAVYDARNAGRAAVGRLSWAVGCLPLPGWPDGRIRLAWLLADLPLVLCARLRSNRVFYRVPEPKPAGMPGRAREHGPAVRCRDRRTWTGPAHAAAAATARYGPVQVAAWNQVHPKLAKINAWAGHPGKVPLIEGTLIRLRPGRPRLAPLWLWASDPAADPAEITVLWQAYLRRFDLEHTFLPRGSARLLHDVALARHVPGSATDLRGCGARGW